MTGLAGLAGLVVATGTGCTARTDDPGRVSSPASTPGTTEAPSPVPAVDPDVALAATVLAQERAVLARVEATVAAQPRLARRLAGTRAVHAAHVTLLGQATPPEDTPSAASPQPDPAPVPRGRRGALLALVEAEEELGAALQEAAFAAESGAFARVLASAAAASAQQAVVLRDEAGAPR